jgi:hypothetical protein
VVAASPGDTGFCCGFVTSVFSACGCSIIGCRTDPSTGACTCQEQDVDGGTPEPNCPGVSRQTCCLSDYEPFVCHCSDAPCQLAEHQVAQCAVADVMKCTGRYAQVRSCL